MSCPRDMPSVDALSRTTFRRSRVSVPSRKPDTPTTHRRDILNRTSIQTPLTNISGVRDRPSTPSPTPNLRPMARRASTESSPCSLNQLPCQATNLGRRFLSPMVVSPGVGTIKQRCRIFAPRSVYSLFLGIMQIHFHEADNCTLKRTPPLLSVVGWRIDPCCCCCSQCKLWSSI